MLVALHLECCFSRLLSIGCESDNEMKRNGEIELLRFIAAAIIVGHHQRYIPGVSDLFPGGDICVDFFFLLSGYLLMKSLQKLPMDMPVQASARVREFVGFLRHKISAFYPEMVLGSVIGLLSAWACAEQLNILTCLRNIADVVISSAMLMNMSGCAGEGFNGVVWYLSSLIFATCILYPVLRFRRLPAIGIGAALLLLWGLMAATDDNFFRAKSVFCGIYIGNLRALVELCVGAGLFECVEPLRRWGHRGMRRRMLVAAKSVFMIAFFWYCLNPRLECAPMVMLAICGLIVISFALASEYTLLLQNKYVAFLGIYSLSLYLGHEFVAWQLKSIWFSSWLPAERLTVYYLSALLFSSLVYCGGRLVRRIWAVWKKPCVCKTI